MATGVALSVQEFPSAVLELPTIRRRFYGESEQQEVRFWSNDAWPCLAVQHEGQFRLARWGNRRARGSPLPGPGWVWKQDLANALWTHIETHPVTILANAGFDGGVWYRVRQGIEGLLVFDEKGKPVVYMLVEPATHYFRTMTRSSRMPALRGEVI
jgi:hypothetical protein